MLVINLQNHSARRMRETENLGHTKWSWGVTGSSVGWCSTRHEYTSWWWQLIPGGSARCCTTGEPWVTGACSNYPHAAPGRVGFENVIASSLEFEGALSSAQGGPWKGGNVGGATIWRVSNLDFLASKRIKKLEDVTRRLHCLGENCHLKMIARMSRFLDRICRKTSWLCALQREEFTHFLF